MAEEKQADGCRVSEYKKEICAYRKEKAAYQKADQRAGEGCKISRQAKGKAEKKKAISKER